MANKSLFRCCDGMTRRNVLKTGVLSFAGLSLPDLLRLRAEAKQSAVESDTALIYVELAGGPTQHETYDPKPQAPQEYRGPMSPISTAIPGVQFSELMVEQARIADKLAVIRSMHHDSGSHGTSSHLTQTGYYLQNRQNRENEMPCFGYYVSKIRGANAEGMPAFVSMPRIMRYGGAAWLGKGYNPFETIRDASRKNFKVPNLTPTRGLTVERLGDRKSLLQDLDASRKLFDNRGVSDSIDQFTATAFDMVAGDAARKAFDISAEDGRTRDRYGRSAAGQNMLLARRLVERGVTLATVRVGGWDDHTGIKKRMLSKGPDFDRAVAALIEDLHDRGLDRKVMVVAMGEFGRTPRINRNAGRDHWGRLMSVMVAGGGLRCGQIIGESDANGSVVKDRPYRPENVLAVAYRHLGIDPSSTFPDPAGRPRYVLENREPIAELV